MALDRSALTKTSSRLIPILLIIITMILGIYALKSARTVIMPLVFAFFIAVLVNPLQRWLERRIPKWLSLIAVLLVLGGVASIFVGAIEFSLELIEPKLPDYVDQVQKLAQTGQAWLENHGLPTGRERQDEALLQVLQQAVGSVRPILGAFSLLLLVASFLALLLLEVDKYRDRTQRAFPDGVGDHIIHAVSSMGHKLRRYFLVVTFTSFLTGILTALWCLILGVDLAIVWGLLAFVLNFIPTLGSIVATIMPAFVATLFQGPTVGAGTFLGLAIMQNILGNFVDPKLQGKYLKLSSFVALFSTVFWGWVWGIPGAFLGVPMTTAMVLLANEFRASRPISIMLGDFGRK